MLALLERAFKSNKRVTQHDAKIGLGIGILVFSVPLIVLIKDRFDPDNFCLMNKGYLNQGVCNSLNISSWSCLR